MLLRKSLLLFLVFFLCIGGMAHAELVENGDFKDGFIGWNAEPDSGPDDYVNRVPRPITESDWGEIGFFVNATLGETLNISNNNDIDWTGRIIQRLFDSPSELDNDIYNVSFSMKMVDGDGSETDLDYITAIVYSFIAGNPTVTELERRSLEGTGNSTPSGSTGFIDYSFDVNFSGLASNEIGFIGFYFNEEEGLNELPGTTYAQIKDVSIVPLPGAIWFLGSGILAIIGSRKKFKK